MVVTNTVQKIARYITALPGDQVKAAMLAWTAGSDPSITALEQLLASEQSSLTSVDDFFETKDFAAAFPSMTEAEMIESSLQVLGEYQRSGEGLTQEDMEAWADGLADSSTQIT